LTRDKIPEGTSVGKRTESEEAWMNSTMNPEVGKVDE